MNHPPERRRGFSRRTFLKSTSTGAAVAAATTAVGSKAFASSLSPKEQFLLDRITFGRSEAMAAEIQARGYTGFLNWQLQLPGEDAIDDSRLFDPPAPGEDPPFPGGAAYLENPEAVHPWGLTPYQLLGDTAYPTEPSGLSYPFPGAKLWAYGPQLLVRGAEFGQHQLRWVMTDFLQNVHNTYTLQPYQYLFWTPFLKEVIYENALGTYSDLVRASGQGASMLWYLGQPDSDQLDPNENYGRELLELHTIGVKTYIIGNSRYETFKEQDIAEVAKILTGWDMVGWHILDGTEYLTQALGDFRYTAAQHSPGNKTVSNTGPGQTPKTYPGSLGEGLAEGEELVLDLCAHPLCALFISKRLIQWFIGDDYQGEFYQAWVRTAVAFALSGGSLKETIRELFNETYFDQICPPGSRNVKFRRPLNKVVAFKRGLDAYIDYSSPKVNEWFLQQYLMGQINGFWPAPNGYQPQNGKWLGTVQPTIQFYFDSIWGGTGLVDPSTGQVVPGNGFKVDDTTLDEIFPPGTPVAEYSKLAAERLMGDCLPVAEQDAITAILNSTTLPGDKRRWALFYVLASPAYQFFC